ncbi:MAG TPA: serine/threonine-protein kinase [Polyangiaceae bacterium]|nr:serine/threonine-protein kinase [Polyangiaceae bacterium]
MTASARPEDDRAAEAGDPAKIGDLIAKRYTVTGVLGRGASGVVYKADAGGATVALKIISPELCHSRQIFERYKREALILRHLSGEHIVRFLDFVEHEGLLVIALEHARGEALEDLLLRGIDLEMAVDIALQICDGLACAHDAGVIHRDLKPANVMVERVDDGALLVRILDFGLAKVVHGEHVTTGLTERDMIFGTPEYMAPEQARGEEVDARCDVYACGVILYEMVTGSVPLRGKTPFATMTAQLTEQVEPPRKRAPKKDVPRALEAVILRALEKDPEKRFASATALKTALEGASERRVISVTPTAPDDIDLHARDTELSLRRSQIKKALPLLEEAERLASTKAAKPDDAPVTTLRSASEPPGEPRTWVWPTIAVVALAVCVVLGVLLALK